MKFKQFRLGIGLSIAWAVGAGLVAYFFELDGARETAATVYSVCMSVEDSWRKTLVPPAEPSPVAGRDAGGNEIAKAPEQYAREKAQYDLQRMVYERTLKLRLETEKQRHLGCEQDRDRTMREWTRNIYLHSAIAAFAPLPILWLFIFLGRILRRPTAGSA